LTDNSLQSADKDPQESRAVAGNRTYLAVIKLDTYRNLQRHRAVLLVIARLSCSAMTHAWLPCSRCACVA